MPLSSNPNAETFFPIAVYDCNVRLCVLGDYQAWFDRAYALGFSERLIKGSDGFVDYDADGHWTVVFKQHRLSHNLIGHEVHHLTRRIARGCGIKDEEAKAWLQGYISDQIYFQLRQLDCFDASNNRPTENARTASGS